jgi:dienelactone hydrolase
MSPGRGRVVASVRKWAWRLVLGATGVLLGGWTDPGLVRAADAEAGRTRSAAERLEEQPSGTITVDSRNDAAAGVAEWYRFGQPYTFRYTLRWRQELTCCGVRIYDLTFPSPVTSDVVENNTVHAELFLPAGAGPFPAAIVLDIMQGNALVSRAKALWLAQHGIAGLVVHMAYYGPRRPAQGHVRLISTNIPRTLSGVRQTVLDIRCATAWLASQPVFDSRRLGLVGTSLGSLIGAIAAANEPRLQHVCLLLGGGGLVDAYADHPLAQRYLPWVESLGGKGVLRVLIAPVDPLTYAPQLRRKNLLLICAARDDIVPPRAGRQLWEATGKPRILWLEATHVGAAAYLLPMFQAMTEHLLGRNPQNP